MYFFRKEQYKIYIVCIVNIESNETEFLSILIYFVVFFFFLEIVIWLIGHIFTEDMNIDNTSWKSSYKKQRLSSQLGENYRKIPAGLKFFASVLWISRGSLKPREKN